MIQETGYCSLVIIDTYTNRIMAIYLALKTADTLYHDLVSYTSKENNCPSKANFPQTTKSEHIPTVKNRIDGIFHNRSLKV